MDPLHHVAIPVKEVARAVAWYRENFDCRVEYQDATWALLEFANLRLALVVPDQHPPHIAFERNDAERYGSLTPHRDGTRSVYIEDSEGNAVEILKSDA
jgi:catechol 2,3-dioxygenase-like lactoylglutathione lyase family enzyme